ncbi:restriction endonuclease subunit S [Lactobacillus acidophilus]
MVMTPEQLRASILQYAMEGKLVKQDPSDEPASVLLEKIKAEKEQLIKDGKIKKSKKLPEISDDEKPFDIPDSWEWVRGATITFKIGDGLHGTPKFSEDNIPFINGSNLKNNKITILPDTKYVDEDEYKKYEIDLPKSTILISLNGTLGKLAKYNGEKVVLGKSAGYFALVNSNVEDYLFYFLESPIFVDFYSQNYTGTTIKNIPLKALRNCPIPLPPLVEQKRIVAKIEKLMPLVDQYAKAYDKLQKLDGNIADKLKQSILQDAMEGKLVKQDPNDEPASVLLEKIKAEKEQLITDGKIKKTKKLPEISEDEIPFNIPDSWKWIKIGNLGSVATGNTPSKSNKNYYGGKVPFVKPANIQNDYLEYNTQEFLSNDGITKGRTVNKGSLLITCIGNLGRNYFTDRKVAYNQQINSVSPILVNIHMLHYFLLSDYFVNSMYNMASSTTLPILNKSKLENLIIPLPPLAEQKRIVTKIEKLFVAIDNSDLAKLK